MVALSGIIRTMNLRERQKYVIVRSDNVELKNDFLAIDIGCIKKILHGIMSQPSPLHGNMSEPSFLPIDALLSKLVASPALSLPKHTVRESAPVSLRALSEHFQKPGAAIKIASQQRTWKQALSREQFASGVSAALDAPRAPLEEVFDAIDCSTSATCTGVGVVSAARLSAVC